MKRQDLMHLTLAPITDLCIMSVSKWGTSKPDEDSQTTSLRNENQ